MWYKNSSYFFMAYTLDALNRVTLEDYGSGVQVGHA